MSKKPPSKPGSPHGGHFVGAGQQTMSVIGHDTREYMALNICQPIQRLNDVGLDA
ncbi:hypothetical protein [Aeromonas sp. MdU4]|uniref:hypothetical protein n=1 Tax=Aeromonas sp. MdU4 TaxID=3342819 RepID=UPI0035B7395F